MNETMKYTPVCDPCAHCCDNHDDYTTCCVGEPLEWYGDAGCECGIAVDAAYVGIAAVVGGVIGALAYKLLHKN